MQKEQWGPKTPGNFTWKAARQHKQHNTYKRTKDYKYLNEAGEKWRRWKQLELEKTKLTQDIKRKQTFKVKLGRKTKEINTDMTL